MVLEVDRWKFESLVRKAISVMAGILFLIKWHVAVLFKELINAAT